VPLWTSGSGNHKLYTHSPLFEDIIIEKYDFEFPAGMSCAPLGSRRPLTSVQNRTAEACGRSEQADYGTNLIFKRPFRRRGWPAIVVATGHVTRRLFGNLVRRIAQPQRRLQRDREKPCRLSHSLCVIRINNS